MKQCHRLWTACADACGEPCNKVDLPRSQQARVLPRSAANLHVYRGSPRRVGRPSSAGVQGHTRDISASCVPGHPSEQQLCGACGDCVDVRVKGGKLACGGEAASTSTAAQLTALASGHMTAE